MSKPSRRVLLGSLAALAVTMPVLGGDWWAAHVRNGDTAPAVRAILHNHMDWMQIDPAAFDQFAAEYPFGNHTALVSWLGLAAPLLSRGIFALPASVGGSKLAALEQNVVSAFLMSTDFFRTTGPEDRPVRYEGFYDPFLRPGANPLANRTLHP